MHVNLVSRTVSHATIKRYIKTYKKPSNIYDFFMFVTYDVFILGLKTYLIGKISIDVNQLSSF